ncbi:MAG TPA: FGGY family carbohydrate kinase [Acidimicrobiales bacterium]|nr:FGGY family carbohydrate kinase [Acidimicrobiales bacterium]
MAFLLGIDVGTTRTKAVLVDGTGAEVASAARPTPFATSAAGVEAPAAALLDVVAETTAGLGDGLGRVAGVGVAGLGESGAPVDAAGRPLAPVIAWHDPRGAEAVALLEGRFGPDLALALGQRVRTVSSVAKLGWLVGPGGVAGVRRWLGVPELVLHRLTGAEATDFSLAARTGAYDVRRCRPLPRVAQALGVPADVFVPPAPAGTVMGSVTAAGAAWLGVPAGIPVTVAGHDHLAGVVGAGAGAGDVVNSVGTAETVVAASAALPDAAAAVEHHAMVTVLPGGDGWAVLASAARAGLVLEAAATALGRTPAELDALVAGADPVDADAWVEAAAGAVRGSGPADVPPLPAGDPGRVWDGVLHALSARTWDAVRRLEEVAGRRRRLLVFGGGSRSRPWLDAKAAEGWLPVVRAEAHDAPARGAALYAGAAAGWWPAPTPLPST